MELLVLICFLLFVTWIVFKFFDDGNKNKFT